MNRSLTDDIVVKKHIIGRVSTTQTPSTGIDVSDLSKAEIIASIGVVTALNLSPPAGSWTFALQHSDTSNASFEAVEAADVVMPNDGTLGGSGVFATIDAAAEAEQVYRVGYVGGKRYVRVVATAASSPGDTDMCVIVVGEPRLRPGTDS